MACSSYRDDGRDALAGDRHYCAWCQRGPASVLCGQCRDASSGTRHLPHYCSDDCFAADWDYGTHQEACAGLVGGDVDGLSGSAPMVGVRVGPAKMQRDLQPTPMLQVPPASSSNRTTDETCVDALRVLGK